MKENGFIIALVAGTLVIGGGLVALGLQQGSRYSEAASNYSDIKSNVESMARIQPYPNEENRDERKKEVVAFRGKVEGLQNALQQYRPEAMEKISPQEFQNRLVKKTSELTELFQTKGISFPEQFGMGFEKYRSDLANPEATAKLNYQLEALEFLFKEMAKVQTYELRNVVREPFPAEVGRDWLAGTRGPEPLYQSLPLELVFLAEEEGINEFINTISSSKEFFFAIDMVRIANQNQSAPVRSQGQLEEEDPSAEASTTDSGFAGFDFGDETVEEEEEEKPEEAMMKPDSSRILGQVLGNEAIYVGLQIRLLLFSEAVPLPEIN